jgi:hypothetical protein
MVAIAFCLSTLVLQAHATTEDDQTVVPSQSTLPIPHHQSMQSGAVDPAIVIEQTNTTTHRPLKQWTEFQGQVTRVDHANRTVQIREGTSDSLIEVPVKQNVKIFKDGRQPSPLSDVHKGDRIILRNNEQPS